MVDLTAVAKETVSTIPFFMKPFREKREFGKQLLTRFYQINDAINNLRCPLAISSSIAEDTKTRFDSHQKIFEQFFDSEYRATAKMYFGVDIENIFDRVTNVIVTITLASTYPPSVRRDGILFEGQKVSWTAIMWGRESDNPIIDEMDSIQKDLLRILFPISTRIKNFKNQIYCFFCSFR
ncbi:hypothetical protein LCGC14_1670780 [marine sediment metagenome]|uniref:Uncharacterized protein n=1 Tax=marine sediment metagenome TaxID=412755 RepID=A0A0F9HSA0_9ZZZZ